ncbi:MAG: N-acyl homoserine lactonase family protein, partial [Kordiimonas sp.]
STLLIGQRDIDYLKNRPTTNARRRLAPWFDGDSQYIGLTGDHDVFGDSSVTILSLPGHTHGHQGLLVKLAGDKYVLLSGDLYHYQAEIGKEIVSRWNKNRAETLASQKRFESIIKVLTPIVIVQHDRQDIKKLPQFPEHLK